MAGSANTPQVPKGMVGEALEAFHDLPGYSRVGVLLLPLYGVGLLLETFKGFKDWKELCDWVLAHSTSAPDPKANLTFTIGLAVAVFLFLLIPGWLGWLLSRKSLAERASESALAELRSTQAALELSRKRAVTALTQMMAAAAQIRSQQTPPTKDPLKTFESIHFVYRIQKDFTAKVTRKYLISAANSPVHFWEFTVGVSDYADPAEYLEDVQFFAADITGGGASSVTYLLTENGLRSKRLCLYFLPRLEPADGTRSLQVNFLWPGLMREMREKRLELFGFSFKSHGSTKEFQVEIYLEDGSGGRMSCEITGSKYPGSTLTSQVDLDTGWPGFVYNAQALPAGGHDHEIAAKWVRTT